MKGNSFGLYNLALERLKSLEPCVCGRRSRIVTFPKAFAKICSSMQITRQQAWELLFIFEEFGFLKIIPRKGVKIKIGGKQYGRRNV